MLWTMAASICCACSRKSRCLRCSCVKNGSQCFNCVPLRLKRCCNAATADDDCSGEEAEEINGVSSQLHQPLGVVSSPPSLSSETSVNAVSSDESYDPANSLPSEFPSTPASCDRHLSLSASLRLHEDLQDSPAPLTHVDPLSHPSRSPSPLSSPSPPSSPSSLPLLFPPLLLPLLLPLHLPLPHVILLLPHVILPPPLLNSLIFLPIVHQQILCFSGTTCPVKGVFS